METIIIISDQNKRYCKTRIDETKADGTNEVIFKKVDKSPTGKQRRLQWLWNTEVALSGIGPDDDKNDVHIRAKYQFARPILLRDDEIYGVIDAYFHETVQNAEERGALIKEFARDYIHTEKLNKKQRAEYLTEFQKYWTFKGVNLTDPAAQGLDLTK